MAVLRDAFDRYSKGQIQLILLLSNLKVCIDNQSHYRQKTWVSLSRIRSFVAHELIELPAPCLLLTRQHCALHMSAFRPQSGHRRAPLAAFFRVLVQILLFGVWAWGRQMRRRDFVTIVGSAVTWPLMVRAQQPAMPVIGFLSGASPETMRELVAAFHRGLADTGFAEGRNVTIEYRWAEGNNDRLPALAMDLVHLKVTAIATVGSTPAALASKAATQTIPIVFFIGTDPVKVGLVASLAQPGGNVTGITAIVVELLSKGLDLMHSLMPPGTKIAVLINPANVPQSASERDVIQNAARAFGAPILTLNASRPSELEPAFETLVSEKIGALVVSGENFFLTQRGVMVALAARHAVPTVYAAREFVLAGGLMSYGTDQVDAVRQVGVNVGRILEGEKVADLPVQQVTKIQLAINLKTAKALGLDIPNTLIGRADEVIE